MRLLKYLIIFVICYTAGAVLGIYLKKMDAWKRRIYKDAPICKYCKNCDDLFYSDKDDQYAIKCRKDSYPEEKKDLFCTKFELQMNRFNSIRCKHISKR